MKQPGRPMRPGQVDSSTRTSLIMVASTPPPMRASDAERERTVRALRERSAEGQLSFDTFVRRIDRAFRARSRDELAALVDDLPPQGRIARRLTDAAFALSALTARLEAAWREPRLPRLTLPEINHTTFTIGRAEACNLVLPSLTVSRYLWTLTLFPGAALT